jgi:hypothetical protein
MAASTTGIGQREPKMNICCLDPRKPDDCMTGKILEYPSRPAKTFFRTLCPLQLKKKKKIGKREHASIWFRMGGLTSGVRVFYINNNEGSLMFPMAE